MKWLIITCNNTKRMVSVQKYLFEKFVPHAEIHYVDLKDSPVKKWTTDVYNKIKNVNDEYVIFGLDDFIIYKEYTEEDLKFALNIMKEMKLNRLELSVDGHSSKYKVNKIVKYKDCVVLKDDCPYSVSCQFSIWKTDVLLNLLESNEMNPWEFETKLKIDSVANIKTKPFYYGTTSAISSIWGRDKINTLDIPTELIDELLQKKMLKEEEIITRTRIL